MADVTETRDYFAGCWVSADADDAAGPGTQPARHAPTAVDLLLKVLGDAHARLRSPQFAAYRLTEIDRQIAELHRERDAVARLVR